MSEKKTIIERIREPFHQKMRQVGGQISSILLLRQEWGGSRHEHRLGDLTKQLRFFARLSGLCPDATAKSYGV